MSSFPSLIYFVSLLCHAAVSRLLSAAIVSIPVKSERADIFRRGNRILFDAKERGEERREKGSVNRGEEEEEG